VRHPLAKMLNADAADIMSAAQNGFRAIVDVKGKLAEYSLNRELDKLGGDGIRTRHVWSDVDGQPDFDVYVKKKHVRLERNNIRSRVLYKKPKACKVELQKNT
jgi:hypothetical protein